MSLPSLELSYEVEIEVDQTVFDQVLDWLPGHVQRVLQCSGFKSAQILRSDRSENPQIHSRPQFFIRYRVGDRATLRSYFDDHAPRMRDETEKLFGQKLTVRRRILVSHFDATY